MPQNVVDIFIVIKFCHFDKLQVLTYFKCLAKKRE